jgi:hypothetical protein
MFIGGQPDLFPIMPLVQVDIGIFNVSDQCGERLPRAVCSQANAEFVHGSGTGYSSPLMETNYRRDSLFWSVYTGLAGFLPAGHRDGALKENAKCSLGSRYMLLWQEQRLLWQRRSPPSQTVKFPALPLFRKIVR